MAFSSGTTGNRNAAGGSTLNSALAQDVTLPVDATDTISSIRWSPVASCLAAASWDGQVRIYDVTKGSDIACVASINTGQPVLSCDFSKDGTTIVAAGADKRVHVLAAGAGPNQSFAFPAHDDTIRAVRFIEANAPMVATGSWDTKLHYWDLRSPNKPLSTLALKERVYSMDTAGALLVAATADKNNHIIDLTKPDTIFRTESSPLVHQTKVVAVCPTGRRWTTASIEGRIGLSGVNDKDTEYNFTWRCHRVSEYNAGKRTTNIYAVNDACFHPKNPDVVATAGSDGSFSFWDVISRHRLQAFPTLDDPVTACEFNHEGKLFAYATGYDWARGYDGNRAGRTTLRVHPVAESEVAKKTGKK